MPSPIPVIDVFAGPGGLGEGFSCLATRDGERCFDIRLSIEKDEIAHRTLELRALFRSLGSSPPDVYYDYLRGHVTRESLFAHEPIAEEVAHARREAWHMELSSDSHEQVSKRVRQALGRNTDFWILIGGPPCQAYSLVGRSRMIADGAAKFAQDARHFLYREYLRILEEHQPPIFIMENVKGLLSAKHGGAPMFQRIVDDLSNAAEKYTIYPIADADGTMTAGDFVIRAEDFGVPQARHRVILCGVRSDIQWRPRPLSRAPGTTVSDALAGLPPLRSRLSKEEDSHSAWVAALQQACSKVRNSGRTGCAELSALMLEQLERARSTSSFGGRFMALQESPYLSPGATALRSWFHDPRLSGITAHEARSHMRSDLHRYFFAATYALMNRVSPRIRDFPASLLPQHENARAQDGTVPFQDRFRVQLNDRAATTVVSHISKDGHYFIHPDPAQCRSLTVREAARLQTFPDNYHFEGNRTQQFAQVGNAVPPLLAAKIGASVFELASAMGGAKPEGSQTKVGDGAVATA